MLANQGFFSKSYRLLNVSQNGNIVAIATVIFGIDPSGTRLARPAAIGFYTGIDCYFSGMVPIQFSDTKYLSWAIHIR